MWKWLRDAFIWLDSNPGKVTSPDGVIYRVRNAYLALGLLCTVLFAIMGVTSVIAAWWNIDGSFPHPRAFAIVAGTFWSLLVLVGLWIIAFFYRARLVVVQDRVSMRGFFKNRSSNFDSLASARWRSGRGLVLRGRAGKLVVEFDNFSRNDKYELIDFFRSAIREDIQIGWSVFSGELAGRTSLSAEAVEARRVAAVRGSEQFLARASAGAWLFYVLSLPPVSRDSLVSGLTAGCFTGAFFWSLTTTVMASYAAFRERHPRYLIAGVVSCLLLVVWIYHFINWPVAGRYVFR